MNAKIKKATLKEWFFSYLGWESNPHSVARTGF